MRIGIVTVLTLFLCACQSNNDSMTLTGTAVGFANGDQLLWQRIDDNNQPQVLDTIEIQGGRFSKNLDNNEAFKLRLLTARSGQNLIVFPEDENLKVSIYKDSMQASRVQGGRSNALYNEYNNTLLEYSNLKKAKSERYKQANAEQDGIMVNIIREEINDITASERAYKRQFVAENTNSIFTLIVLSDLIDRKEITLTDAKAIVAKTNPSILNSTIGITLQKNLEALKVVEVGGIAPGFKAPTPTGEELALADVKGEYTLIDFWASWCKPCRYENPNLVKLYDQYHDKGLNILGVSLDQPNGKSRWIKAIEDDGLPWPQISNLQFWQDPIARAYNVHAIPASFLLDKDGVIIAKDLRGAQLEAKIASLLGE